MSTRPPPVPLLDLRREPELDPELEAAFRRVLQSGHYIMGPEVDAFEAEVGGYLQTKHALGVSSGTDALLLALMTLGVGQGDEVVCPTYTFFATAGAIARVGARPVFVDCDPISYNSSGEQLAAAVTPRTKALVPVHLFGQVVPLDSLVDNPALTRVPIIEDAAQSFGAATASRAAGHYGALACFSFFPSKNLGAFGDAGLMTTADDDLAARARMLRAHGARPKYHHHLVGANFRIDALQAALLRVKLQRFDEYTRSRQQNALTYDALLATSKHVARSDADSDALLRLPPPSPAGRHIFNQYVVRVVGDGARDRLLACLKEEGIGSEVYYPVPMHLQPCFSYLGYRPGALPVAEAAARETLALPIFPGLQQREIERVADVLRDFIRRERA